MALPEIYIGHPNSFPTGGKHQTRIDTSGCSSTSRTGTTGAQNIYGSYYLCIVIHSSGFSSSVRGKTLLRLDMLHNSVRDLHIYIITAENIITTMLKQLKP